MVIECGLENVEVEGPVSGQTTIKKIKSEWLLDAARYNLSRPVSIFNWERGEEET